MAQASYREIPALVRNEKNFRGSSMYGRNTGSEYLVYSYDTIIGRKDLETGRCVISSRKYSSTTSRQQNILRKVWNGAEEVPGRI